MNDSPERLRPLRRPARLLACALALVAGCHSLGFLTQEKGDARPGPQAPLVAASGAPGKYSFRIAPYVFLSDFEVKRDQPLFKELEDLRDQVYKELALPPGTAAVQVYLFEDRARYTRFMQTRYPDLPTRPAFFVAQPRTIGGAEDLLVYTFWGDRIQQDLRHELTHALLHSVIRDVPLWLDEGLAEYFEVPPAANGINATHVEQLRRTLAGPLKPDLARLEGLKEVAQMHRPEYREAWAWAHLMLRTSPEARGVLLGYLQQLRRNRNPGPLGPQLARVFPDPEEALAKHLDEMASAADTQRAQR
jgi:hypothetical protein